jgi:PilZ domain-containing protein
MAWQFEREFFRLSYPPQAAPRFVVDGQRHRIVDIGEGGFRYADLAVAEPGQPVNGTIEFPEGEDPLEVNGVVVRQVNGEIAVRCPPKSIPLGVVLREQRRLRRRFPFRA